MIRLLRVATGLAFVLLGSQAASGQESAPSADLDAFWAELSRTVAEGDFDGYAATYHEDAILVSGLSETSSPISQALDGWKQGFMDTQAGEMTASVEFRFTQRISDPTTAHETGIFHYSMVGADGQRTDQYIHFEALLTKKQDWKMMMEYQKSPATREEWEAAR